MEDNRAMKSKEQFKVYMVDEVASYTSEILYDFGMFTLFGLIVLAFIMVVLY